MGSYNRLILVLVMLLGTVGVGMGLAQEVRYSGSVQYVTGSYYFTERTASLYFNNGLGISGDKMNLYFNIPLITQNTPWISYSSIGRGPLPTGGPRSGLVDSGGNRHGNHRGNRKINPGSSDTPNFTQTDFGDPSLSGNIKIYESRFGNTTINGNVGLKFPVADPNSGFGTGAWDVGSGLIWSQRFADQFLFILSGMYWRLGDMDDLDFNNILSYSGAIGRSIKGGKWMGTANFFGSTQIIDDIDPPLNAGGGISFQALTNVNLNTNFLIGLTESASDFSIGIGWSVTL